MLEKNESIRQISPFVKYNTHYHFLTYDTIIFIIPLVYKILV
jgi:hypothetical protein